MSENTRTARIDLTWCGPTVIPHTLRVGALDGIDSLTYKPDVQGAGLRIIGANFEHREAAYSSMYSNSGVPLTTRSNMPVMSISLYPFFLLKKDSRGTAPIIRGDAALW